MAKINSTYSSGYYISPDTDFRKLEDQQVLEQKRKRLRGEKDDLSSDDLVKRQTFAIPFDLICEHCERRIARGSHVYTNRRPSAEKYMNTIRIWRLEIRCKFCRALYYLKTDPATPKETGGYICDGFCRRAEGDFFAVNQLNEEERARHEEQKAEAEVNPLAALERESEATRKLEERNRQIEAEVEARVGADDDDLLQALRSRQGHVRLGNRCDPLRAEGDEQAATEEAEYQRFERELHAQWQRQLQERLQHREQEAQRLPDSLSPNGGGYLPADLNEHGDASAGRGGLTEVMQCSPLELHDRKAQQSSTSEASKTGVRAGATADRTVPVNRFLLDEADDQGNSEAQPPAPSPASAATSSYKQAATPLTSGAVKGGSQSSGRVPGALLRHLVDDED